MAPILGELSEGIHHPLRSREDEISGNVRAGRDESIYRGLIIY